MQKKCKCEIRMYVITYQSRVNMRQKNGTEQFRLNICLHCTEFVILVES